MKTFKEFLLCLEKYYEPTEQLPSGKTPLEKATQKTTQLQQNLGRPSATPKVNNGKIEFQWKSPNRARVETQASRMSQVRRGADNQEWDTTEHPDYKIKSTNLGKLGTTHTITHEPSGVKYQIVPDSDINGKKAYSIAWSHDQNPQTLRDKMNIISNARKVWREVESRAPHGSILWNKPVRNVDISGRNKKTSGNTRSLEYGKEGMGPLSKTNTQYAEVGRRPSPRQFESGVRRLKPLDPNTLQQIKPTTNRPSRMGGTGTDITTTLPIPPTGNPLMDRDRRRLPASEGPAAVRLAD